MGFEVGKLLARIQLEGQATFARDLQIVGTQFAKLDQAAAERLGGVGRTIATVGAAILALAALSIAKFAEFDKAMSAAGAVTDGFAEKQREMRDAALDAGAVTVFTATEAAKAEAELGRAGLTASEILSGALSGSLALAAAGQIGLTEAAETTASTLTQFRLRGDQATHVADLLAAGANRAQGGVGDLGMALKQSGLVASQMGLSVEETVGTLTAFAKAGLIGSDAGTSFRQMMLNLMTPTAQQTELLKRYNIEAYDQTTGTFIGIDALAGKLEVLRSLPQAERDYALGIIFGSDAIRAANVLVREGETGIRSMTEAVNDNGAAARLAGDLQNNLAGDVEKLGGAFDTALIKTGDGANGVLRDMVQWLTSLVDGYSNLDPQVQQFILTGGIAAGVVLLLGGAFLIAIPKIVAFREAMTILTKQVPALGGALGKVGSFLTGPWGIALALAVTALTILDTQLEKTEATSEQIQAAFKGGASAADLLALGASKMRLASGWAKDELQDLDAVLIDFAKNMNGDIWNDFLDHNANGIGALRALGEELGTLAGEDLPAAQEAFNKLAGETDGSNLQLGRLINAMPDFRQQLIEAATANGDWSESMSEAEKRTVLLNYAQGNATTQAKSAADAYSEQDDRVEELEQSLSTLLETLDEANGKNRDAISANLDYQDALAEVDEAIANARAGVEGYGLTLDTTTEAGRNNMGMLVDLSQNAWDAAEAQLQLDGDTGKFIATLNASRDALIQRAIDLGYNAEEAQALADSILNIPTEREAKIIADTAAAAQRLASIIAQMQVIKNGVSTTVRVGTYTVTDPGWAAGGRRGADGVRTFADGGENHVAQFATGGNVRVWNEPETGGEWYMPDSPAKRDRSLSLAQRMLAGWGYDVVPRGGGGTPKMGDVHFHNPVVRDPIEDAREVQGIMRASLNV